MNKETQTAEAKLEAMEPRGPRCSEDKGASTSNADEEGADNSDAVEEGVEDDISLTSINEEELYDAKARKSEADALQTEAKRALRMIKGLERLGDIESTTSDDDDDDTSS